MHPVILLLTLFLSHPLQASAFQWPFSSLLATAPLRVAVIGAGAGGSSAAFFLSKTAEREGKRVTIDIYEKEAYIGGRSTVIYPYDDTSLEPAELGASIFVDANKNLVRAKEEFNLSVIGFEDEASEIGIWDGEKFVVTMKTSNATWWDNAKLVWRFGLLAPIRTQRIVKKAVDVVLSLYTSAVPTWSSIPELSESIGFTQYHELVASEFFTKRGIRGAFPNEVIDSSTRCNYGQDLDQIHALGALICMATNGAVGIKGGNYQIFEHLLAESSASLKLNTTVTEVNRKGSKWQLVTSAGSKTDYDDVVITGPLHLSPLNITSSLVAPVPVVPYVHLHVTFVVTSSPAPLPEYFGLPSDADVPTFILTTREAGLDSVEAFNSLSYHGTTRGGYIVKFFSKARLETELFERIFGTGKILWVSRKEWDAYPYLVPGTHFPAINLGPSLYYVNAFEPFISTMETQTLAGRNVAELIAVEKWNVTAALKCEPGMMRGWDC